MNPEPLTLRELVIMAEARGRDNWNHTSSILALIMNINRDPKKHSVVSPRELNPYEKKVKIVLKGKDLRILKDVFIDWARPGAK